MQFEGRADLLERIQELEQRLAESEETLRALRSGEVDALVVSGPDGERVYTLKGADEAYRLMVESMAEGAITLSPDGLILFSNEPFASIVGAPLERVIGSRMHDWVAADDLPVLRGLFANVSQEKAAAEVRIKHPNGSSIPAEISVRRLIHEGVVGVCAIVSDLRDRKRNEEIVAAERLARSILEQDGDIILVTDPQGRIIRASRAADQFAGETVTLRRFDDILKLRRQSETGECTFDRITSAIDKGARMESVEALVTTRLTGGFHVLMTASPLTHSEGERLGYIISLTDITARKRAETALEESRETAVEQLGQIEAIYASAPVGLAFLDSDLRFLHLNERLAEFNGAPVSAHAGRRFTELNVESGPAIEQILRRALDTGEPVLNIELHSITGTGTEAERYWIASSYPLKDRRGRVTGINFTVQDVTEMKRSERALRQSTAILRAVNEGTSDNIFVKDCQGRMIWANPALLKSLRRTEDQVLGKTDAEFLDNPGEAAIVMANDQRIMSSRQMETLEEEVQVDREQRTFLCAKSPYLGEDGSVIGLIGIATDVTEWKRTRDELRKNRDRLEAALTASGAGTFHWDLRDYVIDCDASLVRLLGLPENELRYSPEQLAEAIHPEDRPRMIESIRGSAYRGLNSNQDFRGVWPDGSIRWLVIASKTHLDAEGRPLYVSGAIFDITERKQTEEALYQSELRLSTMANAVPEILYAVDPSGDISYASQRFFDYSGTAADSASLETLWFTIVHPDDRAAVMAKWQECLATGAVYENEYRLRRYDGQYRWFRARAVPSHDASGSVVQWFGVVADVDDLKQIQEELKLRSLELTRSNDDLQRFGYVVSHDLQSPLRTIGAVSQLMGRRFAGTLGAEGDEMLGLVHSGVSRMVKLIQDLLDYSRVSGGKPAPERPIDCNSLFGWAVAALQQSIQAADAVVTSDHLPFACADEQLVRVFQNLIDNAIKYKSNEPPRIHVSAVRSGVEWIFSVQDNGIGFEMRYAERVFGVFQRLHGVDQYEGTGIGLAICKRTVERYGGRIWVRSEPGHGSTFYFTLPAVDDEEIAALNQAGHITTP